MEQIITLYFIINNEKNRLWYPSLVGKTLNEAQFSEVLCQFWIDFEVIKRKVRNFTD